MSEITARLTAALANRYKIEREIGGGGMATVYLAEPILRHLRQPESVEWIASPARLWCRERTSAGCA